jgi:hypothetical protein
MSAADARAMTGSAMKILVGTTDSSRANGHRILQSMGCWLR